MSYEQCEKHNTDATNGCEECTRELQRECRHEHSVCSSCNLIVRGLNPEPQHGAFDVFVSQEEVDFSMEIFRRGSEIFGPTRAAGVFLGTGLIAIEESGGTLENARNILNELIRRINDQLSPKVEAG